jgi:hypothetical protein
MPLILSILSLTLLGLLTTSFRAEANPTPLATQVSSDVNGMSECIQGKLGERNTEVLNKCSGFRGVATQTRREFSYNFPVGALTFYTELNSPSKRFPDGAILSDGRRSRSFFITQIFLNGRQIDIQAILTSKRRSNFRCYIVDKYATATCDLPDGTWVQYKR